MGCARLPPPRAAGALLYHESCKVRNWRHWQPRQPARMAAFLNGPNNSGTPTQLSDAEGKMEQGDRCEPCDSPARSQTLHTPVSFLNENGGRIKSCLIARM